MSEPSDVQGHTGSHGGPHTKRSRVLLSCAPCRTSKLKCDRTVPCSNCLKKGRGDGCVYAPKPEKVKPAKSMAARLKRLEAMVREMADDGGPPKRSNDEDEAVSGQVVEGNRSTTYIGATHFMAVLEDIEDLKSYFDEPEEPEDGSPEGSPEAESPEMLLLSKGVVRTRADFLRLLPERRVIDRLIMRYFSSNSPSQHTVHRPTFVKQYNEFWQDPSKVDVQWLALLFMVMALGVFFSTWSAPHELEVDSPISAIDRFKQYRAAAAWALVSGKYTSPGPRTIQPLLLYVEADFLVNRASQTSTWLLASVCIRVMLRMGLHRDPSKLANISPFEGEMRRRMWNLAIQLDLIVSFHMGLPSMIHGIESDCNLPRNLIDEDFDENSPELPLGRPNTEYTHMSYPIFKSIICRLFGQVARLAHSLTLPKYSEVMRLDSEMEETWKKIPPYMKVRPLEDCVTDPPMQIIQRFGIASLFQKSRCVLHRRYLVEAVPKKEHEFSRRACLQAAMDLLTYQSTIYEGTKPGGMLAQNGWFVTGLALHDFLLAAMIVYLVIQNEHYSEVGGNYDWMTQGTPLPDKAQLRDILKQSRRIWVDVARGNLEVKKAADILKVMLRKIHESRGEEDVEIEPEGQTNSSDPDVGAVTTPMTLFTICGQGPHMERGLPQPQMEFSRNDLIPNPGGSNDSGTTAFPWIPMTTESLDWTSFDDGIRATSNNQQPAENSWIDEPSLNDIDLMAAGIWDQGGMQGQYQG